MGYGFQSVLFYMGPYAKDNSAFWSVHTNTAESSLALVKRGIMGIYHNVSWEYLHRYLWQFDFIWNNRNTNDGERTLAPIQAAEGKPLMYRPPIERA